MGLRSQLAIKANDHDSASEQADKFAEEIERLTSKLDEARHETIQVRHELREEINKLCAAKDSLEHDLQRMKVFSQSTEKIRVERDDLQAEVRKLKQQQL